MRTWISPGSFHRGEPAKIRLVNERRAFHGMQHPIHLHGQRFVVLAVNGVPNDDLAWKDTVLVPPARWWIFWSIPRTRANGCSTVTSPSISRPG